LRPRSRSPLEGLAACILEGLEIRERRELAKLRLRVAPVAAAAFSASIGQAVGIALPLVPNRVAVDHGFSVAWTAPGAWLALGERTACAALADASAGFAQNGAMLVTWVSSGLCALEATGNRAAELLETGCPLDLQGGAVGEGGCASSLFDQIPIFLQRPAGSNGYTLVVERPLARRFWTALADNAGLLPGAPAK
jgi:heterotetrameric sarcosine oxidase gamma subunit